MMKVKKGKLLLQIGTVALLIITVMLVIPLFRNSSGSPKPKVRQVSQIKRPENPYLTKMINAYEKEILSLMKKTGTPGAGIAIVKDSSIVYVKGLGFKVSNKKDSVDIHTVFRIGSVSKCFASFLTGILVEDHAFNWNDPVVKYLPDFSLMSPEQTSKLTISHVLSHTTGLPYHTYTNLVEEGLDLETLLGKLKEVQLSNDVGKEYSYQNVAYSLISEVIHKSTGKTYEEEMKEKVFVPLGMSDASINYKTLMANQNLARPHRRTRSGWVPAKITDTYYNVAPAGGVNASISDMAHWMIALLGYRENVIHGKTMEHLYTPMIEARSKNRNYKKAQKFTDSFYGLGWRILHYPNDTLIYHGGYVNGYRSEVAFDPSDKIAVCILSNGPGELPDNAIPIFFKYFNEYRKDIVTWERKQYLTSANPL